MAAADRWAGANRFGTTPAEARAGESLEQLLAEEEPDVDLYAEVADDEGFGEDEQAYAVAWDVGVTAAAPARRKPRCTSFDDPDGAGDGPLR